MGKSITRGQFKSLKKNIYEQRPDAGICAGPTSI